VNETTIGDFGKSEFSSIKLQQYCKVKKNALPSIMSLYGGVKYDVNFLTFKTDHQNNERLNLVVFSHQVA